MRPLFFGRIENGNLKLDEADIFRGYIMSFEGKEIQLTIERKSKDKTLPQLGYYFGAIVPIISKEMGIEKDQTHPFIVSQCWTESILVDGKEVRIPKTISDTNTIQFTEFIEVVKRWASIEHNIVLPDARKIEL